MGDTNATIYAGLTCDVDDESAMAWIILNGNAFGSLEVLFRHIFQSSTINARKLAVRLYRF